MCFACFADQPKVGKRPHYTLYWPDPKSAPANLSRAVSNTSYCTLGRHLELKKFHAFEVLVICYKIHSVRKALKIMGIESESHFIKRYKAHRGRTPGEFCKKRRKEWEEKKRNKDPEYLRWVQYWPYQKESM